MKVRQIKSNMTEVYKKIIDKKTGEYFILVSYQTPVVVVSFVDGEQFVYVNAKYYSATTTKHINYYLREEWNFTDEQIAEFPRINSLNIKDSNGDNIEVIDS